MRRLLPMVFIVVVGCGGGTSGPEPPVPGPVQTLCLEEVCVDYPSDCFIESGEDFITLSHPGGPQASVGRIDMRGVVANAGLPWPASSSETMEAFWALLDELGDADLDELVESAGGVVDTVGGLDEGRLWHRLLPIDPPRAWGVEMRAPDSRWEGHAAIITRSLRPPPG